MCVAMRGLGGWLVGMAALVAVGEGGAAIGQCAPWGWTTRPTSPTAGFATIPDALPGRLFTHDIDGPGPMAEAVFQIWMYSGSLFQPAYRGIGRAPAAGGSWAFTAFPDVLFDSDGERRLIGGHAYATYFGMTRFDLQTGAIDQPLSVYTETGQSPGYSGMWTVTGLSDGSVLVGGVFNRAAGQVGPEVACSGIVRLGGGQAFTELMPPEVLAQSESLSCSKLVTLTDGRVLALGFFPLALGGEANTLVRSVQGVWTVGPSLAPLGSVRFEGSTEQSPLTGEVFVLACNGETGVSDLHRFNGQGWVMERQITGGPTHEQGVLPNWVKVLPDGRVVAELSVGATSSPVYVEREGAWRLCSVAPDVFSSGQPVSWGYLPGGRVGAVVSVTDAGPSGLRLVDFDGTTLRNPAWPTRSLSLPGEVYALSPASGHSAVGGAFVTSEGYPPRYVGVSPEPMVDPYWVGLSPWDFTGVWPNGAVRALAGLPDGRLVMGGSFTQVGSLATGRVALYSSVDEVATAMGSGVSGGDVLALAVGADGWVYVGGTFTTAGGLPSRGVARWREGTGWQALGAATGTTRVRALAFDGNGHLVAGGDFSTIGGVSAQNVARWDGTAWHAMGSLANVNSLHRAPDGSMVAGGLFFLTEDSTHNVARWDGSAWRSMGGLGANLDILNSTVTALASGPGGRMFLGHYGEFEPVRTNRLHVWLPAVKKWRPFVQRRNDSLTDSVRGGAVFALAVAPDGDLLIGGEFTAAENSGRTYDNFARYEFDTGPAVVIGESGGVTACRGRTARLEVMASGSGPLTYQWYKDDGQEGPGVAVDIAGNPSAATAVLSLFDTRADDAGAYRCLVSGPCGHVWTDSMVVTVNGTGCGAADMGAQGGVQSACGDGQLNNNDFVAFIDLYFAMEERADLGVQGGLVGSDGVFDNNDFVAFIDLFFGGC